MAQELEKLTSLRSLFCCFCKVFKNKVAGFLGVSGSVVLPIFIWNFISFISVILVQLNFDATLHSFSSLWALSWEDALRGSSASTIHRVYMASASLVYLTGGSMNSSPWRAKFFQISYWYHISLLYFLVNAHGLFFEFYFSQIFWVYCPLCFLLHRCWRNARLVSNLFHLYFDVHGATFSSCFFCKYSKSF